MVREERDMIQQIEEMQGVERVLEGEIETLEKEIERYNNSQEIKVRKTERDAFKFRQERNILEGSVSAVGLRKAET